MIDTILGAYVPRQLKTADITMNGNNPWDIQVRDPNLYRRLLLQGSLGLGEGYQAGEWDCADIPGFIARAKNVRPGPLGRLAITLFDRTRKRQTVERARENVQRHYDDAGIELFEPMLGSSMQYSCAYFDGGAETLDEAQLAKQHLLRRKLALAPGMHVLDVGCGYGTLAKFLAEQESVAVTGITHSREQAAYARRGAGNLGVEYLETDYRDAGGKYDRIVSVGMFEHVGAQDHRTFMECLDRLLKTNGRIVLHCILGHGGTDPWIDKYIFPGGFIPAIEQIRRAMRGVFECWDLHEFGPSYARTLREWRKNFAAAWPRLAGKKRAGGGVYDERFRRTWEYYLATCEGAFQGGHISVGQFVLAREKKPADYRPVR